MEGAYSFMLFEYQVIFRTDLGLVSVSYAYAYLFICSNKGTILCIVLVEKFRKGLVIYLFKNYVVIESINLVILT